MDAGPLVHTFVIGMSDGLTVPFTLAARLSGARCRTPRVIIIAGSFTMGLGSFLAARTTAKHYQSEGGRDRLRIWTTSASSSSR